MSKLLVCGSRGLDAVDFTTHLLPICVDFDVDLIVTGGARGIDRAVEKWADRWLYRVKTVKPDYEAYGRKAPLYRDMEMAEECDACVAFWDGRSRGTRYTVDCVMGLGKPYVVFVCDAEGKVIYVE